MYTRRIRATEALEIIRRGKLFRHRFLSFFYWNSVLITVSASAREQVWPLAGFQEQLVLFELCQYNPTTTDGIYQNWRNKIERHIREGRVPR